MLMRGESFPINKHGSFDRLQRETSEAGDKEFRRVFKKVIVSVSMVMRCSEEGDRMVCVNVMDSGSGGL